MSKLESLQLVGMKHSGKSSLGRLWSHRHGWAFYDLDHALETIAGGHRTSREIYRDEGKEGFQRWETEAARRLVLRVKEAPTVIAWGGGTITNPEAVEILRPWGTIIMLHDTAERLYERIERGGRPAFLSAERPWEDFLELYEKRSRLMRELTPHQLDAQGAPLDEVLEKLETLWNALHQ